METKSIKPKRVLAGLAIFLAFLLLLVALAPANMVVQSIDVNPISLQDASGTIWHGSANAHFNQIKLGELSWRVQLLRLLLGEINVDYEVVDSDLHLSGSHQYSSDGSTSTINGRIGSTPVNSFVIGYDIGLSGDFLVSDVKLSMSPNQEVTSVNGDIHWQGGQVRFNFANNVYQTELEAANGNLAHDQDQAYLFVTRAQDNQKLLDIRLETKTGWLHVKAYNAFLEFANILPSQLLPGSAFAFEVSERIY